MSYSGIHRPTPSGNSGRPNPDGYQGGPEDFETVWTLKGHKLPPAGEVDPFEAAKISRNHGRLSDADGFC